MKKEPLFSQRFTKCGLIIFVVFYFNPFIQILAEEEDQAATNCQPYIQIVDREKALQNPELTPAERLALSLQPETTPFAGSAEVSLQSSNAGGDCSSNGQPRGSQNSNGQGSTKPSSTSSAGSQAPRSSSNPNEAIRDNVLSPVQNPGVNAVNPSQPYIPKVDPEKVLQNPELTPAERLPLSLQPETTPSAGSAEGSSQGGKAGRDRSSNEQPTGAQNSNRQGSTKPSSTSSGESQAPRSSPNPNEAIRDNVLSPVQNPGVNAVNPNQPYIPKVDPEKVLQNPELTPAERLPLSLQPETTPSAGSAEGSSQGGKAGRDRSSNEQPTGAQNSNRQGSTKPSSTSSAGSQAPRSSSNPNEAIRDNVLSPVQNPGVNAVNPSQPYIPKVDPEKVLQNPELTPAERLPLSLQPETTPSAGSAEGSSQGGKAGRDRSSNEQPTGAQNSNRQGSTKPSSTSSGESQAPRSSPNPNEAIRDNVLSPVQNPGVNAVNPSQPYIPKVDPEKVLQNPELTPAERLALSLQPETTPSAGSAEGSSQGGKAGRDRSSNEQPTGAQNSNRQGSTKPSSTSSVGSQAPRSSPNPNGDVRNNMLKPVKNAGVNAVNPSQPYIPIVDPEKALRNPELTQAERLALSLQQEIAPFAVSARNSSQSSSTGRDRSSNRQSNGSQNSNGQSNTNPSSASSAESQAPRSSPNPNEDIRNNVLNPIQNAVLSTVNPSQPSTVQPPPQPQSTPMSIVRSIATGLLQTAVPFPLGTDITQGVRDGDVVLDSYAQVLFDAYEQETDPVKKAELLNTLNQYLATEQQTQ